MKHLILDNKNNVVAIGENYSQPLDDFAVKVLKKETRMHNVDNQFFDISFKHEEVETVPQEVLDNSKLFNYENNQFKKRIDLLQEENNKGYAQALADIMGVN